MVTAYIAKFSHKTASSTVRNLRTELNAYTRVQQVPLDDTDPLMWCKQHVQEFPRLTRMTRL